MATAAKVRPDADIEEELRKFIRGFDPLKQARPYLSYSVENGKVTIKGHVRPALAKRVLLDNIPDIPGVVDMDASELYDDENLRLELGRLVPSGVLVKVNFGHILLFGPTPEDPDALVEKIQGVGGVTKVDTQFY